jgi:Ca2+:H+ antiporter
MKSASLLPVWTIATPVIAWLLYGGTLFGLSGAFRVLVVVGLIGSVLSRGPPRGGRRASRGRAFRHDGAGNAVTVIEVALIVS